MLQVRDNFGALICMADPQTGLMETEYKKCRFSVELDVGKHSVISRGNKITTVTRTRNGFYAVSVMVA